MIKKILFLLLFVLSFFLFGISKIKAEGLVPSNTEGICRINNCFVPAPTIVIPKNNSSLSEIRPIIRGLTWKRTLVDIYLDGKYQGPVLLKEHENHLQSFFWQPSIDLTIGQHYVYTIAYSTKGYDKTIKSWDQSKESTHLYFLIKKKEETETLRTSQQKKVIANEKTSKDKNFENISQSKDNQRTASPSDQKNSKASETKNLSKEQSKNLGGIAILKEESKQNVLKIIGYLILGIIILIFIIKYYLDKKREYLNKIMAAKMKDEEDYPPPPPPLNQDSLGI